MNRRQFIQSAATGSAAFSMGISLKAFARHMTEPALCFPPLESFQFNTVNVDRLGNVLSTITREAYYFREQLGAQDGAEIDMVAIQGGRCPVEEAESRLKHNARDAEVAPFYLGRTAVTQEQWRTVAELPKVTRELESEPACFVGKDLPVECVSWQDAQEFCLRLSQKSGRNYRLPSELEWETACRAEMASPFNTGATLTSDLANYSARHTYSAEKPGTYHRTTTGVGQYSPNAYGLYDMHGNVWEWCADTWQESSVSNSQIASANARDLRVVRGGSWADEPARLRSSSRAGSAATSRNRITGFRIALSLELS